MLNQVADGVWVRQSEWVGSNATVVRGESGLVLVDPDISGDDLAELADDLDRLGEPVVAGFSTHPHRDHLLWHSRFGDVPRYATAINARSVPFCASEGKVVPSDTEPERFRKLTRRWVESGGHRGTQRLDRQTRCGDLGELVRPDG